MSLKEAHIDLSNCVHINHLWNDFINQIGIEKANQAVRQALDLKAMRAKDRDLPILFTRTGGVAFTTSEFLKKQTGLHINPDNKLLLLDQKLRFIQILKET